MKYPVFNVDRDHKFDIVQKNLDDLKTLAGPVYKVEHDHNFKYIETMLNDLKSLNGPIYAVERDHKFKEITVTVDHDIRKLRMLMTISIFIAFR